MINHEGWTWGLQGGAGIVGQIGDSFSPEGTWFGEVGVGTPGASLSAYFISDPLMGPFSQ